MDMGNLVDEVYTGSFNATLTATYYSPVPIAPAEPADLILPISAQRSAQGQPSHFRLPAEIAAASLDLPKNAIRAVVSVSASGNADEEFWYTNVDSAYTRTFEKTTLLGNGPFREIQVLIDETPAGFIWPVPTIFTGGIVPSLWRPIVSPSAFDLPEYEIDITPFLPILLDGEEHTIELQILSYDSTTDELSTSIGNDWLVSAKVFVWTDADADWKTTGTLHQHHVSPPLFRFKPLVSDGNATLATDFVASRNLAIISTVQTSAGSVTATWMQGLHYDSYTQLSSNGNKQNLHTTTAGTETTVAFGSRHFRHNPLVLTTEFIPRDKGFELTADLSLGINALGSGKWSDGVRITAGKMGTQMHGTANWVSDKGGDGVTSQVFASVGGLRDVESVGSYGRRVNAVGGVLESDWEKVNSLQEGTGSTVDAAATEMQNVLDGVWTL